MQTEDQITVDAPREVVIEEMQDPENIEVTLPVSEASVELVDELTYKASLKETLSVMTLELDIDMEAVEFNPPDSFTIKLSGTGSEGGTTVEGHIEYTLTEVEGGRTQIDQVMDLDVSGKLASLGLRILRSTVTKRTKQMAQNLEELFAETEPS